MTADISSPATIPATPDVERVLSRNFRALAKFVAFRLCLIVTLMVGPIACIRLGVVQESTLAALPVVAGLFVLIHTVLRLRFATRIFACKRVLRHYPLTHHSRVVKKEEGQGLRDCVRAARVDSGAARCSADAWGQCRGKYAVACRVRRGRLGGR